MSTQVTSEIQGQQKTQVQISPQFLQLVSSPLPTSQENASLPGNDFIIFLLANLNTLVGEPDKE